MWDGAVRCWILENRSGHFITIRIIIRIIIEVKEKKEKEEEKEKRKKNCIELLAYEKHFTPRH